MGESFSIQPVRALSRETLVSKRHLRPMDFHNHSAAGKEPALDEKTVSFLRRVLHDEVVAAQSLTFIHGSEQVTHQDLPYVVAQIPSHLAASRIALEVHLGTGSLGYFPGSHRLPRFDFGNGIFLTPESLLWEDTLRQHLEMLCVAGGTQQQIVLPKKGDLLPWHVALARGGTWVNNPNTTCKSFVTPDLSAMRLPGCDRRAPECIPKR